MSCSPPPGFPLPRGLRTPSINHASGIAGALRREFGDGVADDGDLTVLVGALDVDLDQVLAVFDPGAGDGALAGGEVADDVVVADLHVEPAQEAVVADPVGHQVPQPGDPLGAVVVGGRHPDALGQVVVPVHALRGLGHSLQV